MSFISCLFSQYQINSTFLLSILHIQTLDLYVQISIIQIYFASISFLLKVTIFITYEIFFFHIFLSNPFHSETSQIHIKAIAKSSVINSSFGAITKALFSIAIHLSVSQSIVYAQPRFLNTSELFHIKLFDFSRNSIDSFVLSFESKINHFK